MIVTIDGPAGSGKSTAAALLAEKLNIAYLDTGAMYRALTLAALEAGIDMDDEPALLELAGGCDISFKRNGQENAVLLNGNELLPDGRRITDEIRSSEVTEFSHKLASQASIRRLLVERQQLIAQQVGSLVTEGRDQGTAVFPQARCKFYLDGSSECRARRRYEQMIDLGREANYERILADQKLRDRRDMERQVGPLKPAVDAEVIDTTEMDIDEVVECLRLKTVGK